MSRTASRTLVAALAAVFVLAAAEPAVAQKAKARSGSRSGASSSQVKRVAPPQARSSSPARTVRAAPRSPARSTPSAARSTVRVNRAPAPQSRPSTTVRVNRAPASQQRTTVRVNRAPAPQDRTTVRVNRAPAPQERTTVRINRAPEPDSRIQTTLKSLYTRRAPADNRNGNGRNAASDDQKRKISERYTQPRDDRGNRGNGNVDNRGNNGRRQPDRPGNRGGYNPGYRRGYDRGYYDGWHNRYVRRHHYRHYHYYGPRWVWGFHYGGFGFYHGYWHFAIVIGGPVVVYRNYCGYYNYCWWDGRGASLVTWDAAARTYPATYTFTDGSCVELWIRTTAGEDYAVKVDPRYWNARDPGDLYAALWAQLDQEGQLQLEDINGALYVFPAGMIQQIEARACR